MHTLRTKRKIYIQLETETPLGPFDFLMALGFFPVDLLQVDLLPSGVSLFGPRSCRLRTTKSQEVDLSCLKNLILPWRKREKL